MEEIKIGELEQAVVPLVEEDGAVARFDSKAALRQWLVEQITWLVDRDFERLLRILYLIDVSEQKVRRLIQDNEGEDAAGIIADLILERQVQKIISRKKYVPKDGKYFADE